MDTIEVNSDFEDLGAKATYGPVDLDFSIMYDDLDITQVGVYERVYEATYGDLSKTVKRVIHVVDQTPLVITLNAGMDTIYLGETWIDASVTATDNSMLPVTIETTGVVLQAVGTYYITYKAVDTYLNDAIVTRIVTVIEQP